MRPLRPGPVPKHRRLREILTAMATDELGPGAAVPSERVLAERFEVSRATVREAVGALVNEGLLERVHGKGTFVAAPAAVDAALHLASFTQDMIRRGLAVGTEVLAAEVEPASAERAQRLRIDVDAPVLVLWRRRDAGGQPMAIERGVYPLGRLPGLEAHDLAGSIYDLLGQRYDARPDRAEQVVSAEVADNDQARMLAIGPGEPLLVFARTSFARGVAVEDVVSWYRADRYRIHMGLTAERG
ncbi:MAG: GntR family transcriptional regulator [Nitriliruptoraceae bacterium]|nr:GntR family transcriptional regulator [Nitriliruptoraceae bacterium]